MTKIQLMQGDITALEVDAIVNAANSSLLGGGGVDGAIHRVAGSELLWECKQLGRCEKGEAKVTKGYNLPAKYVIHTVGPIYRANEKEEATELLANCYSNSLRLAKRLNIKSIAFPCISTGVYRFPKKDAARIAIESVRNFISKNPDVLEKVIFCCYIELDYEIYELIGKE